MGEPRTSGAIRDASSVVLWREREGRRELFWVRRSREVSLGGGFYAFPGGRVDDADVTLAHRHREDPLKVAAARELFEEAGVLVADTAAPKAQRDEVRKALLAEAVTFEAALSSLEATLRWDRLVEAGRWLTPPFMKVRFDTRFYLFDATNDAPEVWPGELASGEWITPAEALERWKQGRALLHPPALHFIRTLLDHTPSDALHALRNPPHMRGFVAERIEFQAGILLFPVRTPTLPPATHTNTYLVGRDELIVVDPASPYEEEQAALERFCRGLIADGRRIREIVLTHEHHDHVGGVESLRTALGVPVRAHKLTAERLEGRVRVDGLIEDGETWTLPGDPEIKLRAVFTPGHARGHLCFFEERSGALITGDMVAGIGTIVVDPPEGDMADYVASLRKLRHLPVNALFPAHGPAIPDGPRKLDEYLAHRAEREAQVRAALEKTGGGTPEELVPHVYSDVPPAMHPLAARSLLAVLEKLVKDGHTRREHDRFRPVS